jgi:hypothetical protein
MKKTLTYLIIYLFYYFLYQFWALHVPSSLLLAGSVIFQANVIVTQREDI